MVGGERQRIADLETQLRDLEQRSEDRNATLALITPVIGDAIRRKIRDDRTEMIEAFYPIIGQLVARSVAEAIRDLARSIDQRMRTSFSPATLWRRLQARAGGLSDGEIALRGALPFFVSEIFLIHRPSGLLLHHLSGATTASTDSDLVSGMLTAIRDFAEDSFGRGREGQLDEIQYGEQRILIETAQHVYLAVVVNGVEPPGFHDTLRERLYEIQNEHIAALRQYDGDATRFAATETPLRSLFGGEPPAGLRSGQKRLLLAMASLLIICIAAACLAGLWLRRELLRWNAATPTPVMIVVTATPGSLPTATGTPTTTPTATNPPTPTPPATATPMAVPTPTHTATPTATVRPKGIVTAARLNIRGGPGLEFEVLEGVAGGQVFSILGRDPSGRWWQVCCLNGDRVGWGAAEWMWTESNPDSIPVVPAGAR